MRFCVIVLVHLFCVSAHAIQDVDSSIREFDRKMVATPAELFEVLTKLQPESHIGRTPKSSGLSDFEKAGLKKMFSK